MGGDGRAAYGGDICKIPQTGRRCRNPRDSARSRPDRCRYSDGHDCQRWNADHRPESPSARAGDIFARAPHYVREEKALDLMTALRKMTLMPAQRLQKPAPLVKTKVRIR